MKHEWHKHEKNIYLPKLKPEKIHIPAYKYYTVTGEGNPNEESFREKTAALFAMSYGIRMMPKKGPTPNGYFDYRVYPLEGIWTLKEGAVMEGDHLFDKDDLKYKIMIRQPEFVTGDLALLNIEAVSKNKPNPNNSAIKFEEIKDGLSVQIMHVGSYDSEPASFDKMAEFLQENHLERISEEFHREIYISDARKVTPEKLKTVLRYAVKEV